MLQPKITSVTEACRYEQKSDKLGDPFMWSSAQLAHDLKQLWNLRIRNNE